jgi:hypothetical protein
MIGIVFMGLSLYFLPPYIGILSLAVAMTGFYFISFTLNSIYLAKIGALKQSYYNIIVKTTIFSILILILVKLMQLILARFLSLPLSTAICGITGIALYIMLIICFKLVSIKGFIAMLKKKPA